MPRRQPHQPQRHAMAFRRQTEPARRGEIKRRRIARHFADDKGQIAAAQALLQCEQRIFGAMGRDMDQAVAQGRGQAGAIGAARLADRGLVLHPQPGPVIGGVCRGHGQRQCGAAGLVSRGKQFGVVAAPILPGTERGTT